MPTIRDLFVEIGLKVDDKPLRQFDKGITTLRSNLRILRNVLLGTAGAITGIGFALRQAGQFEQTQIAFEVLLGSFEKAKGLLDDLLETARTTPFLIPQVLQASQQLIALGTPMNEVVRTLRMLGDVASGTNTELFLIVDAFSKARASGFLFGEVFRQFRRQGVPITEELEKITGKTGKELRKMGAAGEITFDLLQQAFVNMTGQGGKFFRLMERQAKTFLGLWSNIKDSLLIASIAIGEGILPQAKKLEKQFFDFLDVNRKIIALKGAKFLKEIGEGILFVLKIIKDMAIGIKTLADAFGGLGNVIKWVSILLLTMFGISTLSAIGNIALAVGTLAKTFLFMGNTAAIATLKATALPLAMGVAVVVLLLLLEDLAAFFTGRESLTALIIKAFEEDYPNAFKKTEEAIDRIIDGLNTLKLIAKDIIEFRFKLAFQKIEVTAETAFEKLKEGAVNVLRSINEKLRETQRKLDTGEISSISDLFGGGLTPALAPATSTVNNLGPNVNQFNVDLSVSVAGGDGSPEATGEAVRGVVREELGDIFQATGNGTRPRITR